MKNGKNLVDLSKVGTACPNKSLRAINQQGEHYGVVW